MILRGESLVYWSDFPTVNELFKNFVGHMLSPGRILRTNAGQDFVLLPPLHVMSFAEILPHMRKDALRHFHGSSEIVVFSVQSLCRGLV